MPKNAASLLADLLESWAVPQSTTPERHRGFTGGPATDLERWREHHQAAELVRSVDHMLQGMEANGEDVEMFMESVSAWYAGVHFATTPWGSSQNNSRPRALCAPADVKLLRALGRLIDTGHPSVITEDDRRTLVDTLEMARQLVLDDATMTEDIRRYVLGLIVRAQVVIDQVDRFGAEAVRQVALELGGALSLQAERVRDDNPERSSRLKAAAWALVAGFAGGTGSGAATQITGAVAKQITGTS